MVKEVRVLSNKVSLEWRPFEIGQAYNTLLPLPLTRVVTRGLLRYVDNYGAPGAIPTRDLPLRRRTLYATELREPNGKNTVNRSQETEEKRKPSDF